MKQTLMMHEINEKILDLDLENYILTMDDGLYSQYFYWPILDKIKTQKILFISPGLVSGGKMRGRVYDQYKTFPTCYEAMDLWFEKGDNSNYMNVDEIKYIMDHHDVIIGGHSYDHVLAPSERHVEKVHDLKIDTENMMDWFHVNLNIKPTHFCLPFNKEQFLYRHILFQAGIKQVYGSERIDVDILI